ncbi:hypothetical protein DYB30_005717, partial [Aphanomyces astaci]
NGPTGTGVTNTNIGAVDFFGFDKYVCMAVLGRNKSANKFATSNHTNIRKAPIATKKVAAPPPRKDRSASVDVPLWAGAGEVAPVQKEGSKQRRKRKLSEDALAEAVVSDQDRKAVSHDDDDDDDDDDDNDTDEMTVFGKPTSTETSKFLCVLSTCSDDIKALRRRLNITVEGTVVPDPVLEFAQMRTTATALKTVLLRNIEESQYKNPTPIQMQSIPSILKQRDVLGIAPTGSGKTAAFAIPMLLNLGAPDLKVSIHPSMPATTCTVNYDVVIATPLRLVHLITNDNVKLDSVEMICLDEADRLFDMGFVEQIDDVFAACTNPKMQRMMFSATMLQVHKVIKDFRTGTVWVLICTDLMSRGIDFKGVNMVINYDFPQRYRIETVSGYDLQKANKRRLMKAKADGTAAADDATADE